ncbi:hypothetical protein EON81_07050 [bacterium]|nr:MAG: hypothetical protein EON81_07050 [bacterium]
MPFAAIAVLSLLTPLDVYREGPYDSSVPKPEATLGYAPGTTRITTFRDQERTLQAISAKASSRMRMWDYGKSTEGRPLRLMAFSSPKNIGRLEEIRKEHERLGKGEKVETLPIVWINECIHGNEPASFESAMVLAYTLAASNSPRIRAILDKSVVVVNPVYNPDGHERFAVYYNSIALSDGDSGAFEKQEPGLVYGRVNHYRFDMNRDRISLTQDETVAEVREMMRWNPQVYVDQHGQVENYFFPPNPMSVNANVDRNRLNKWTDYFGRATARAFDARGWSYYVKDIFDLYYPGYLDTFTSLTGAVGMTHETDGSKFLVDQRDDGSEVTLQSSMEKHLNSALAVAEATSGNQKLLDDYRTFKARAVSGESAGKFKRVVVTGPRLELERLGRQLLRAGVESGLAQEEWSQADSHDYWSATDAVTSQRFPTGSLVIDIAQGQGAIAKTLLEPQSDFEPEFFKAQREKKKTAPEGEEYPGPEGSEFYDLTGWALPYAYNLAAWWCESAPPVKSSDAMLRNPVLASVRFDGGQDARDQLIDEVSAYAVRYRSIQDIQRVAIAQAQGFRVRVTTKPMKLGEQASDRAEYPAGTFLILAGRNEPKALPKLRAIFGPDLQLLKTGYPEDGRQGPGSESTVALKTPKIAIVFGNGSSWAGAGSIWFSMERVWKIPFTAISSTRLSGDLSEFTSIVIPGGTSATVAGKLKDWVSGGGNLVVLGNPGWALGSAGFVDLKASEGDNESLPGALFRAKLDRRSRLSYGYDRDEIAVPISGDRFYTKRKEGGSVVTLGEGKKFLTGFDFEGTEKALDNAVWLQDVPVGRGHAVIFTEDPTDRCLWPGLDKLVLNAMLLR